MRRCLLSSLLQGNQWRNSGTSDTSVAIFRGECVLMCMYKIRVSEGNTLLYNLHFCFSIKFTCLASLVLNCSQTGNLAFFSDTSSNLLFELGLRWKGYTFSAHQCYKGTSQNLLALRFGINGHLPPSTSAFTLVEDLDGAGRRNFFSKFVKTSKPYEEWIMNKVAVHTYK